MFGFKQSGQASGGEAMARWAKGLLVLLTVAAALTAVSTQAADIMYEKRFIEEVKRKVGPIVIPPPNKAERNASPHAVAKAITIDEAKALMGLDALGPDTAARIPGGKLGQ